MENPDDNVMQEAKETLTQVYERLRHSTDSVLLSQLARQPLPDKNDAAQLSRATTLLEAISGNSNTPVDDRKYLAESMPYPNILVKLSQDPDPEVRCLVAANKNDKNWLVGRLSKDPVQSVRTAALLNPNISWKMRLEGAEDSTTSEEALDFLSTLGTADNEPNAKIILATMVRRAVALNPNTPQRILERLSHDDSLDVKHAVEQRLSAEKTL